MIHTIYTIYIFYEYAAERKKLSETIEILLTISFSLCFKNKNDQETSLAEVRILIQETSTFAIMLNFFTFQKHKEGKQNPTIISQVIHLLLMFVHTYIYIYIDLHSYFLSVRILFKK
jgi:hypothetical protein